MPSPVKEAYFTPESLASQAQELLQAPGISLRKDPPSINPSRLALLVLDMQCYFLDEASHAYIPSAGAIIPGVDRLIRVFYKHDLPVIFTRHTNTTEDAGLMGAWWRELIAPDDPRSAITPLLDPSEAEIIEKTRYDAFFDTRLDERLRAMQVEQVVISGVMTHLCCESTARSAFMRGFQPFFLVDGTATYNRYFHVATLTNLSHGFAALSLVADILAALEDG